MQLLSITNKFYSKTIGTNLQIISTLDDTSIYEKDFEVQISSLHSSPNFLLLGLCTGPVILLNYTNNKEFTIYNFLQKVTCVFNYGQFYYFGSESGKVVMFIINQENQADNLTQSDLFLNNDFYNYRIIKEIQHNAPIVHIASDGDTTYVFDCRGKITVYPENSAYDMLATCMQFKKYLFVSEKKFLYCKTSTAFACVLSLSDTIDEFCFSNNGGVMFIKTKTHIHVYNKNFRILNKINFKNGRFVFDEINNRLILLNKEKIKIVNNVIDQVDCLNEEMDDFVFEATKINEMKVHLQDDDQDYGIKNKRARIKVNKLISNECSDSASQENQNRYNNDLELFEDVIEESEKEEEASIVNDRGVFERKVCCFMPTNLEIDGVIMYSYNKYGYVIKKELFTEFVYHSTEMSRKEFRNIIRLASMSDKGCLFVEDNTMFFDGESIWEKEIQDIRLIDITNDFIICVTTNEITFYKFSGIKVFSGLIIEPVTICSEDSKVALFCKNHIHIYNSYNGCESISLCYNPSFCCFNMGVLYFTVNKQIYMLKNNIAMPVGRFEDNPLLVTNNYLLTCNDKLYPVPNINFTKLTFEDYAINHTKTIEENDNDLIVKIESAIKEENKQLANDLISLLSCSLLKSRFDTPIVHETLQSVPDNATLETGQVLTSLLYEDTSEINKENDRTPKKKRFNPFAKK